jgi:hypothetical protein
VAGHGIGLERVHHLDHVLAIGLERGVGALPGVAAIKQQDVVVAALGADRLDHGRDPVDAAHPAIGLGERVEILDVSA